MNYSALLKIALLFREQPNSKSSPGIKNYERNTKIERNNAWLRLQTATLPKHITGPSPGFAGPPAVGYKCVEVAAAHPARREGCVCLALPK